MKQIYAVETKSDFDNYEAMTHRFMSRLEEYQRVLKQDYKLKDLPKGIIWTSSKNAMTLFSNLPIPAFTNKDLIYMSPDVKEWRELFLSQLEGKGTPHIRDFYETLSEDHVLTIVGHELTHHSDLFVDDFEDVRGESIWFEEGMCQYLPRKHFLADEEFYKIAAVEEELVNVFHEEYGSRSLDQFGSSSYIESLSSIMFDYWRSFLVVRYLVEERYDNDIQQVFLDYCDWHENGRKMSLSEYFRLDSLALGEKTNSLKL